MTDTETATECEIVYRTAGAWGAGKGSNLTVEEVDENFACLEGTVEDLEAAVDGGGIQNIVVAADQITFTLENGRTAGPFELPRNAMQLTGDFAANFSYPAMSLFVYDENRMYLVTEAYESETEFDPDAQGTDGPIFHKLRGGVDFFDISAFIPGAAWQYLSGDTPLFQIVTERPFVLSVGATESPAGHAYMRVQPALDTVCTIRKNGADIGAISVAAGQNVGAVEIDTETAFDFGDVLSVDLPIGHTETETETATEGHGKDFSFVLKGAYVV